VTRRHEKLVKDTAGGIAVLGLLVALCSLIGSVTAVHSLLVIAIWLLYIAGVMTLIAWGNAALRWWTGRGSRGGG
jgi:hypothetical protein